MKHLLKLNKYFFKYKWTFIIGVICTTISNYLAMLYPQFTGFVVEEMYGGAEKKIAGEYNFLLNKIINHLKTSSLSFNKFILTSTLILLTLSILRGVFLFFMRQTIIVGSRKIEYDLKNDIYQKYQNLDLSFYKRNFVGDLMNRISEDVNKVRMYVGPVIMYIVNTLIMLILSVYFMFNTNVYLTLVFLIPFPILAYIIYKLDFKIQKGAQKVQELLSKLTTIATETFSGIRVIQSHIKEKERLKVFKASSSQYQNEKISLEKKESFYNPAIILFIGVIIIITVAFGGIMIIKKQIGLSVLLEFIMLINMLIFPVSYIGWIATIIQNANVSQKRINEFMAIESTINVNRTDDISTYSKKITRGDIEFINVNFIYEHTKIQALKNFNLKIKQGEKVAIMGKIASGKSSFAQLLVRNFDVNSGEILIDGIPVKKIRLEVLRQFSSIVAQDIFIFRDTILNNLQIYGKQIDKKSIMEVLKVAEFYDEVMGMPMQLDSMLGEKGVNLSGGQKQRLAIARALLRNSELYIFDDSFSAIDQEKELMILNNINSYLKNKTQIFITHKILKKNNFDRIVVMEKGEIKKEVLKGDWFDLENP